MLRNLVVLFAGTVRAKACAIRSLLTKGGAGIGFQFAYFRCLLYSRMRLQESGLLDAPEDTVQGVVAELGLHGTVVIVAGYIDGTPRLFIGSGGGLIGLKEGFSEEIVAAAQNLVHVGQSCLGLVPRETSRSWPRRGSARFALLTLGGVHAAEVDIARLDSGSSPLSPLHEAAGRLLVQLTALLSERANAEAM